jgi:hypothetical protein
MEGLQELPIIIAAERWWFNSRLVGKILPVGDFLHVESGCKKDDRTRKRTDKKLALGQLQRLGRI